MIYKDVAYIILDFNFYDKSTHLFWHSKSIEFFNKKDGKNITPCKTELEAEDKKLWQ